MGGRSVVLLVPPPGPKYAHGARWAIGGRIGCVQHALCHRTPLVLDAVDVADCV